MKNYFKIFRAFLVLSLVFCIQSVSFSQPPPPPAHAQSFNQAPSTQDTGAPIGEGIYLLIGLAGLYGAKKMFDLRKTLNVDNSTK